MLFEGQGKLFLSIEKVLEKMGEHQPYMHCLIVFHHIFEIKVSHSIELYFKKYDKTKLALNLSKNFKAMV